MTGWGELILAYGVFLLSHSIPVRPPVRPWLVTRLGARGFTLGYSLLSLAVLSWVIVAAGRAPYFELWPRLPGQGALAVAAMAVVCQIVAFAAFLPNPLSFGGWRNARFDSSAPGIVGWLRHPFLGALAIWAFAHLVANGDLAHVILFGGFAGFALVGMRLIDRRRRREMGPERWRALAAASRNARGRAGAIGPPGEVALRVIAGLGLLIALIWLHPAVIGLEVW